MLRFLVGDSRECLRSLPSNSVHVVVTSPPYWACRNYGAAPTRWADGQEIPLGLEPNPKDYIRHLVELLDECRRVLHPMGLMFLNLGDTWAGKRNIQYNKDTGQDYYEGMKCYSYGDYEYPEEWGLKTRNLTGIPFRTAFMLQKKGWNLRAFFPWVKRNAAPVATELKRPSSALEYFFMFAKEMPHYWDKDAVLIKSEWWPGGRLFRDTDMFMESLNGVIFDPETTLPLGVVLPTVIGDSEHQARYPEDLVSPWIKLGSSHRGCCPTCLTPYKRIVDKLREPFPHRVTTGWAPLCKCDLLPPVPCRVLDPFSGSGTTQAAALRAGRDAIYIDQSNEYAGEARVRLMEMDGAMEHNRIIQNISFPYDDNLVGNYSHSRGW